MKDMVVVCWKEGNKEKRVEKERGECTVGFFQDFFELKNGGSSINRPPKRSSLLQKKKKRRIIIIITRAGRKKGSVTDSHTHTQYTYTQAHAGWTILLANDWMTGIWGEEITVIWLIGGETDMEGLLFSPVIHSASQRTRANLNFC
jgi:hypothetical protein